MMHTFTLKSRIRDVYSSPIGRDVIEKLLLQLGGGEKFIKNPLTMSLKLSSLQTLVKKPLTPDFWEALLSLLNSEKSACLEKPTVSERKWWKESVFYQIYPRSFCDSNADGIGDIPGIIAKLDYLRDLGVDALWICPIYDSPQDDNGYDIRDYFSIDSVFGSMEDFDLLLSGLHDRGMRLIMDLVVNHTSDEHEWFRQAVNDPESKYRDYYFFRKGKEGGAPPNNWISFFSGPAWKETGDSGSWSLCLFSKKQMDLNWDNPEMRQDVYKIIRWWLDKGVDGFRLDVINLISKTPGLPDGNEFIGELMGMRGIERYFYGPNLHDYLHEMREEAFEPYDAFTVGETPGIGIESGKLLTAPDRRELDMMFSFDHLEMPGKTRFDEYVYDAAFLKTYYTRWMRSYGNDYQTALFYDNHDNPRMLSKIDPQGKFRDKLAKMLAVIQLTLRGTPFIYQGQELGAVNMSFNNIDELRDVESLNMYRELTSKMPEAEALRKVGSGARDHARIPMQWDSSKHGGFTTGQPWIKTLADGNDTESQSEDKDSVLNFYKRLLQLRKNNEALVYGEISVLKTHELIFAYSRESGGEKYYIECNLSDRQRERPANRPDVELVLSNYPTESEKMMAYEAGVYRIRN